MSERAEYIFELVKVLDQLSLERLIEVKAETLASAREKGCNQACHFFELLFATVIKIKNEEAEQAVEISTPSEHAGGKRL